MTALRERGTAAWVRVTAAGVRSGWLERLVFAAVAGVLLAIYLRGYPHLGGFQSDDWGGAARTRFLGGWWNEVSSLWGVSGKRPLLMFYNPTSYRVFGDNAAHHHLWQLLLSLIAVTSFFWLLRELDVPALWAGLVGLLVLFYPAADSLRLWISVDYGNLSLAFCALGIIAAIRGLRAPPGRSGDGCCSCRRASCTCCR